MEAKGCLRHLGSMKNWRASMCHLVLCLPGNLEVCRKSTPKSFGSQLIATYSREGPSSRTFICMPSLAGASMNHVHGHQLRAIIVRVVSNELANVRVEVYHCHGLRAVSASCREYWLVCVCRLSSAEHVLSPLPHHCLPHRPSVRVSRCKSP
jgi:hypothetical protein